MKVGDLIWDDERGQYAVLLGIDRPDGDYPLYYLLWDDGDTGYGYREDICLVHGVWP